MTRWVLVLCACALAAQPRPVAAQDSTAAMLARARDLYERLELERALPLLREVVSPGWPFDVSAAQRVEANLYLGATLLLLGSRDSALTHFRAALERDPFADLDATRFTPSQVEAFHAARRSVFAVGVRPVVPVRLDPRTGRMTFTVAATHAAQIRAEVRLTQASLAFPLFNGELQGLRQIDWDGVLPSGQLAPSGRYAFVVLGRSQIQGGADSATAYFDIQQELAPLEDSVPDLQASELLAERYSTSAATGNLLKGVGIAAGAFLLAGVASNRDLGRSQGMAAVMGTMGITAGAVSFFARRGRSRPENAQLNERRRSERAALNEQIRRRNAARVAETILVITPAAGRAP